NAPLAGTIQARLVGGNHAGTHGGMRSDTTATGNGLRAFMHIHEVTHAMASAMTEVQALLPQRLTAQYINLLTGNAFREHHNAQRHHAFELQGDVTILLGRHLTYRPYTRNVGRPTLILPT